MNSGVPAGPQASMNKVRFWVYTLSDSPTKTHQQTNVNEFMAEGDQEDLDKQITKSQF